MLVMDDFCNKVIRTVVKITSPKAKGQAKWLFQHLDGPKLAMSIHRYVTIMKGNKSNTASKVDQAVLKKFC